MECQPKKMELLPVHLKLLLLLSVLTFTYAQSDLFRSSDKFTARSFPQPEPGSGSRIGIPSNRRNVFFPPPDRLSPTLRPILSLQEFSTTAKTLSQRPTTPRSRFHPSGPSKFATKKVVVKPEYDDEFYDYYDDYYYDEPNATLPSGTTTQRPKPIPLSKTAGLSAKHSKTPTAFSKFHTGTFRFSAPRDPPTNRETIPRDSVPDRETIPRGFQPSRETIPRNSPPTRDSTQRRITTQSPFRFRFTASDNLERTTKPSTLPPSTSGGRKGLLADLLAQLKNNVNNNENPSSNDVDSNREARILEKPNTVSPFAFPTTRASTDSRFRITNSTESTFSVGSVQSSHSIKGKDKNNFSTTNLPTRTTDSQTSEASVFRSEGKRLLEDETPEENLTDNGVEPEGPPVTKSFSSLFENIQIAVDPSLLPPGYSVEETVTETAHKTEERLKEPELLSPTSTPKLETTISDVFSKSTIEDILSSLPQEEVTSLLPPGYISSSTEASFQSNTERSNASASGDVDNLNSSTTETENSEVEQVSSLSPSNETAEGSNVEEDELPGVLVSNFDVSQFLPPGYKPNESEPEAPVPVPIIKNVDISKFLPPGFKPTAEKTETLEPTVETVDISKFLPPGYKPTVEKTKAPVLGPIVTTVDISKFLPPGFKPSENTPEEEPLPGVVVKNVDLSSFLPPGYKPQEETKEEPLPGVLVKKADLSSFLPPGYNPDAKPEPPTTTEAASTTLRVGKSGIVFPRRPKRPKYLSTTTTRKPQASGPTLLRPKITNLFDRIKGLGATEYVVPVVTQSSRKAGSNADLKVAQDEASTTTTSTTTTTTEPTTTTPPVPTTPGICGSECRLAASLRLVNGTGWQPELANRDTIEFQNLANEVESELDGFFRSSSISLWYDFVEVDSFNKDRGSVIVSYILILSQIKADIDTRDLKERLNGDFDRIAHSLGNYTVDPEGTDFIVIPEKQIYVPDDSENFLIPEWLIAVIVIGLASFLFILIFGVVALVSRAAVRKRANVPLTEEFLNNLNALQGNGIDNYAMNGLYDMDPAWNEKYPEKTMKPPSSRGKGYNPDYNVNIYDSWRTDYSGPYSTSSANHSKRRADLDFDGKQFYKDDPYDF